ncbi:MAG: zf-TFIIB domain-containing protein [Planctomycetota bacterium]
MSDEVWIDERTEGDRPCPVCGNRMHIERKDQVSIDVCAEHGIWLDSGELGKIVSATRRSGRRKQRTAMKEARRKGKIQGSLWGFWSLLWD